MSWNIANFLQLGRVSNLPTVWTNTIAGVILSGASAQDWRLWLLLMAMTLAYTGGMFLNDAFDQHIDAIERPERPIPSGRVSAFSVYLLGFGMLASAVGLVAWCALTHGGGGWRALLAAIALAATIVLYNAWHKNNPLSPLVMGLCRMLVYVTAGWSLSAEPSSMLYMGAVALLCYLIGLTYTAKQENLGEVKQLWPLVFLIVPAIYTAFNASTQFVVWFIIVAFIAWLMFALHFINRRQAGDIPRAVISMIAGISLVDAMFVASLGEHLWVVLSLLAFGLTLFLQKYIAGT